MISNIGSYMSSKGITVSQLSAATGLSRTTITPISKAATLPPKTRFETIQKISKAISIPISMLISEVPYTFKLIDYKSRSNTANVTHTTNHEVWDCLVQVGTELQDFLSIATVYVTYHQIHFNSVSYNLYLGTDAKELRTMNETQLKQQESKLKAAASQLGTNIGLRRITCGFNNFALSKEARQFLKAKMSATPTLNALSILPFNETNRQYFFDHNEALSELSNEIAKAVTHESRIISLLPKTITISWDNNPLQSPQYSYKPLK